jgi:hypothetical protein
MSVGKMLLVAMILWAIFAIMSHGLGVLIYISIQAMTTGVFAFFFMQTEKVYGKNG